MRRRHILAGLLLAANLLAPRHGVAQPEPEEWIVAIGFEERVLSRDLLVLRHFDRFYLPLGEFAALLYVPVEREESGVLEGSVSSTGRAFRVDPGSRRFIADGAGGEIGDDELIETADGVYLEARLVELLLGIELDYDPRAVALMVDSEDALPIEVLERQEQLRERLHQPEGEAVEPLRREVPYALFSPPFGDVDLLATRENDGSIGLSYDTLMSAEVGYLTGFLFATGDDDEPLRDARIMMGRESADGGVFGVDSLTEAWAGDLRRPVVPLVGGGELGPGVLVSSLPLDRPDDFDVTTVEGNGRPGWDVELYQNGLLIDFRQVGQDGRYSFEDVPLLYGINRFRLVFYGPQGQIVEEYRYLNIGDLVQPGETLFRAYAGLPNERLLAPILPGEASYDDPAFSAEVEHGFSKNFTASAFLARAPVSREIDTDLALYGGAGARVSWRNFFIDANVGFDESGGYAFDAGVAAEFDGVFLTGRHARFFEGFESIIASEGVEPLDSLSTLRANTWLRDTPFGPISLSLRGEQKAFRSGRDRYEAGADLRHSVGPVYLDHGISLRHEVTDFGAPSITSVLYEPAFSFGFADLWARGTARLNLTDGETVESVSGSARYRLSDDTTISGAASYSPMPDTLNVSVTYSHSLSFGAISVSGSANNDGDFTVGIGLSFSFGFDEEGDPYMSSERLAQSGSVSPFVYLDRNADGMFEASDDAPLGGVGLQLGRGVRPDEMTDEDGGMMLTSLATTRPVVIDVDRGTLEDPFWVPALGPIEMQPRPGRTLPLEIPIVEGGEISGYVTSRAAGDSEPVGGVALELVDARDRVLQRTRSLRDGFYLIEGVPPGHYRVRVRPGQDLDGLPVEPLAMAVTVTPGGDIVENANLFLITGGRKTAARRPEGVL